MQKNMYMDYLLIKWKKQKNNGKTKTVPEFTVLFLFNKILNFETIKYQIKLNCFIVKTLS
jgi:hypothetical protein